MSIPTERIDRLHALAREATAEVDERNRVRLPRRFRRFTCDDCDAYLRPGATARVRLQSGHVVVRCLSCGATKRYPYEDR